LGKPVEEYLFELKSKLAAAVNFAEQHAKHAQANYAAHYNIQARDKQFV